MMDGVAKHRSMMEGRVLLDCGGMRVGAFGLLGIDWIIPRELMTSTSMLAWELGP
jgi:hypothetical protein